MTATNLDFLRTLENVIIERLREGDAGSYTATLAAAGRQRIAQKVGEEAIELALAAVGGSREAAIAEAADLIYHVLVLLNDQDVRLADVVAELEERHAP